jgi:hypothetical protein
MSLPKNLNILSPTDTRGNTTIQRQIVPDFPILHVNSECQTTTAVEEGLEDIGREDIEVCYKMFARSEP